MGFRQLRAENLECSFVTAALEVGRKSLMSLGISLIVVR